MKVCTIEKKLCPTAMVHYIIKHNAYLTYYTLTGRLKFIKLTALLQLQNSEGPQLRQC